VELLQAILSRRTTRSYATTPVPYATVEKMVKIAANAPSACNRRGWRCILLQSREDLDWLYRIGGSAVFRNATQALIVCYGTDTDNREWNDNIQSAAAFIAYFQLVAHEQGIGSCWICHLPPMAEIMERFAIPAAYSPVAAVTFGYQADNNKSGERKESHPEKLLSQNKWNFPENEGCQRISVTRKLFRKIYYMLPFRVLFRGMAERYEKKFDE